MNKKGFTLVELLAVVALMGVLVIILSTDVVETFKGTKKQNFVTETREVCREATNTFLRESIVTLQAKNYYKFGNDSSHALNLNGRQEFNYFIKVNTDGEVIGLLTWDGTYTIRIVNGYGIDPANITETDIDDSVDTSNMTTTKAENILR